VQMAVNYGLKNPYSPVHCIEPKLRAVRGPGGLPGKVSKSSISDEEENPPSRNGVGEIQWLVSDSPAG
jgi:hypothetical protein